MSGADVERNYIKFFPACDMAFEQCVLEAETKVAEIINCEFSDIVTAIEGHNAVCLFEEFWAYAVCENEEVKVKKERYKVWAKELRSKIGKFAGRVQEKDLFDVYCSVPAMLKNDFWDFFYAYKIWKGFSGSFLAEFEKSQHSVSGLFEDKNFVKKFGALLAGYLQRHFVLAVELFVHNAYVDVSKVYHFPVELSQEDKELIIARYINGNAPSISSLRMIAENLLDIGTLDSKVRFRAKKRLEKRIKESCLLTKLCNFIGCNSKERVGSAFRFEQSDGGTWNLCFSRKWVRENLDYPTLLNNLIFIFQFVDSNCRSSLIQPSAQTIRDLVSQKSSKEYYIGDVQQEVWEFQIRQINEYCTVLRENGINLEDVFRWFFQEYLKEEFGVVGFSFNVSADGLNYEQKCKLICPEIEKVLKLWKAYCESGVIDREFYEFSRDMLSISDLPSLCRKKYIYAKREECGAILRLLFSSQSNLCLGNVAQIEGKYTSPFSEILSKKKVNVSDFEKWQQSGVNFLVERGILEKESSGLLVPHWQKISILRELNDSGVYCPQYHPELDCVVREMCDAGWLEESATLFSREEERLLNFILNDSLFKNSLGLRNKYLHGSNPCDEISNKRDYMMLLSVVVLIVLKINEDLRLREPEGKRFTGVSNFVWDVGKY